jgi:hypothetical protein
MSAPAGSMGGCGWEVLGEKRHEESFYAEHRQRRDEAIARGEDPYAGFKQQVAARQSASRSGKLWNKLTGKDSGTGNESETTTTKKEDGDDKVAYQGR